MTPEEVVDRLIGMGYLKYLPESEHSKPRGQLIETLKRGYLMTDRSDAGGTLVRRMYWADSENLAEGGVGDRLLEMRDILQAEGFLLDKVEDVDGPEIGRYDIIVNGRTYPIFKPSDSPESSDWGQALKRLLEIVNSLLLEAGSRERLYGIYGGNEGRVIFLTEEMYNFLKSPDVGLKRIEIHFPLEDIGEDGRFLR